MNELAEETVTRAIDSNLVTLESVEEDTVDGASGMTVISRVDGKGQRIVTFCSDDGERLANRASSDVSISEQRANLK